MRSIPRRQDAMVRSRNSGDRQEAPIPSEKALAARYRRWGRDLATIMTTRRMLASSDEIPSVHVVG